MPPSKNPQVAIDIGPLIETGASEEKNDSSHARALVTESDNSEAHSALHNIAYKSSQRPR